MGDIDFGLAMVAARIATSEKQKGREGLNEEVRGPADRRQRRGPDSRKRPLSGATFDVIKGNLVLIPTGESRESTSGQRRNVKMERGKVVRIDRSGDPSAPKRGAA